MQQIFTEHNLVRAQTLAIVEGPSPDRKRILLQFLYESKKQTFSSSGANPLPYQTGS
jgi:hypothetical protein